MGVNKINITIGEVIKNKTYKYLFPIINTYSNEFNSKFNPLYSAVLATAIWDMEYEEVYQSRHKYLLFIVMDVNGAFDTKKKMYYNISYAKDKFKQFLSFVRNYKYYFDDYPFDGLKGHQHCVILKIPKKYEISYQKIIDSKFSEAYSIEDLKKMQIRKFYPSGKKDIRFSVLTKDKDYKQIFVDHINSLFNSNMKVEDMEGEFDFPFSFKKEIFNL